MGEMLKPGPELELLKSLLEYHPKGHEKTNGMTGIKVGSFQGEDAQDTRCFYMVKEGGIEEDFSAKKCLEAIALNPPRVQIGSHREPMLAQAQSAPPTADVSPAATGVTTNGTSALLSASESRDARIESSMRAVVFVSACLMFMLACLARPYRFHRPLRRLQTPLMCT